MRSMVLKAEQVGNLDIRLVSQIFDRQTVASAHEIYEPT